MNIPLDNQVSFLNQRANVNFDYFSPILYDKTENTDDLISVTVLQMRDAVIQYQIEVPQKTAKFIFFFSTNLHFTNDKTKRKLGHPL